MTPHPSQSLSRGSVFLASALGLLLTACGGGSSATAPPVPPTPPKSFVYALQNVPGDANQIHGYQLDPGTGQLSVLPGFPLATGGTGSSASVSQQLAYDAANHRLYAANTGSKTVTAFSVDPTSGILTPCAFSPIGLGAMNPYGLTLHPSGSPLMVWDFSNVMSFNILATSTINATGSPYALGASLGFSGAVSHNGAYFYLGGNTGNSMVGFAINPTTGVLTALSGSPFTTAANYPANYASDASGRLFLANVNAGTVSAFTTTAGVPTLASTSSSGLTGAAHGILHPSGHYLVADRDGDRVGVFHVAGSGSGTTLTAVTGSPFPTGGDGTHILGLDSTGKALVAANATSRNLTVFAMNETAGSLALKGTQATNALGSTGRLTGLCVVPKN